QVPNNGDITGPFNPINMGFSTAIGSAYRLLIRMVSVPSHEQCWSNLSFLAYSPGGRRMSPYLFFIIVSKAFPFLVKLLGAVVGSKTLLNDYYSWVERFRERPDHRSAIQWCLAYFLPLAAGFAL